MEVKAPSDRPHDPVAYLEEQLAHLPDQLPRPVSTLGPSAGSLVTQLRAALSEGLSWLHGLDAGDPIWSGTNGVATVFKLGQVCAKALAVPQPEARYAWWDLALVVRFSSGHLPEHVLWRCVDPATVPSRWLVEASWLEHAAWSNAALSMAPVAARLDCLEAFAADLERLSHSTRLQRVVSRWLTKEADLTRRITMK